MKWLLGFYSTGRHSLLLFKSVLAFKPPDLNLPALSCSPIRLGFSQCMRVKCSVDFRMAPKKSSKGKGAAAEPTRESGWIGSKSSESDLETLVSAGLLAHKSVIPLRPAFGEDRPYENTGEIVAFTSYLE